MFNGLKKDVRDSWTKSREYSRFIENMSTNIMTIREKGPQFSGLSKGYPLYRTKNNAYLRLRGCTEVLAPRFGSTLPANKSDTIDVTTTTDVDGATLLQRKKWSKAREANALAYLLFMNQQDSVTMINKIEQCSSTGYETRADLIYQMMQRRFCPNDSISKMEMEEKMGALKLGSKQDPQDLDEKICEIQTKFGCNLSKARRACLHSKGRKEALCVDPNFWDKYNPEG